MNAFYILVRYYDLNRKEFQFEIKIYKIKKVFCPKLKLLLTTKGHHQIIQKKSYKNFNFEFFFSETFLSHACNDWPWATFPMVN